MNHNEAYRILKRKFPERKAYACYLIDNNFTFAFSPTEKDVDENGIVWGLDCYSVNKNTGEIKPEFFQSIVGKMRGAPRFVLSDTT